MINYYLLDVMIITISVFAFSIFIWFFFKNSAGIGESAMTKEKSIEKKWLMMGASVRGKSHMMKKPPLPCQDNHYVEQIDDRWGIALVSDGLGSKPLSHMGSEYASKKVAEYLKSYILDKNWNRDKLPSKSEWNHISYDVLYRTHVALESFARTYKYELNDLAATLIAVVYSPMGLLVTHIGDGRAGYLSNGVWKSMMTPINGQTSTHVMPITSSFWDNFQHVGRYIESRVIEEKIDAFTLMSDGCENFCYLTSQWDDEVEKIVEVNLPYKPFFDPVIKYFTERSKILSKDVLNHEWKTFLTDGQDVIANESDDKTLIVGILLEEWSHEYQNSKA